MSQIMKEYITVLGYSVILVLRYQATNTEDRIVEVGTDLSE